LFVFEVTREVVGELVVLAENEREARQLACDNALEVDTASDEEVRAQLVCEVEDLEHVPPEWRPHPPIQNRSAYGRAASELRTCQEIAEEIERELPLHKQPGFKATRDLFGAR
jgi:hypothetical protein